VTISSTDQRLQGSLKALNIGAILLLIWSTLQVIMVLEPSSKIPLWMNNIHRYFTNRDMIYNRVTGFAYEPSWLGNQMVILYLPLWFSSLVNRTSVYKKTFFGLPLESLLLLWGFVVFVFTQSRISYFSFLFVSGLIILYSFWWFGGRLFKARFFQRFPPRAEVPVKIGFLLLSIGMILVMGYGVIRGMSRFDERMRSVFRLSDQIPSIQSLYLNEAGFEIANRLAFAERVVYWSAGYQVYEDYPILGAGLGNAGFFFRENLPSYAYHLTEIREALDPLNNFIPNPKNLWVRLLSETGILGFSTFMIWFLWIGFAAWGLFRNARGIHKMLGLAGVLGIAASLVEGFSLDSFALPQFWILPGLVTAAWWSVGMRTGTRKPEDTP
jgi:O-antigen ligase